MMTVTKLMMDLESLNREQELIKQKLEMQSLGESKAAYEEVPRGVIPEEQVQEAEAPTFALLGADICNLEESTTTPTMIPPPTPLISSELKPLERIFKEIPSTPAPSPTMATPISTPIVSEVPSSVPASPSPVVFRSSGAIPMAAIAQERQSNAGIFRVGFGQSIKVEVPIPTTPPLQIIKEMPSISQPLLPIVQISEMPGEEFVGEIFKNSGPESEMIESAYSEGLGLTPSFENVHIPITTTTTAAAAGKTFLIPWDINGPTEELTKMVRWVLGIMKGEDRVRFLFSGDYEGHETNMGFTSHFLTNESLKENREKWRNTFPNLVWMIESTGLEQVPFQVEVRKGESMSWSLRSELLWPHIAESMIVVVPSRAENFTEYREYSSTEYPLTFEEEVLQMAPCPVLQYKL